MSEVLCVSVCVGERFVVCLSLSLSISLSLFLSLSVFIYLTHCVCLRVVVFAVLMGYTSQHINVTLSTHWPVSQNTLVVAHTLCLLFH